MVILGRPICEGKKGAKIEKKKNEKRNKDMRKSTRILKSLSN